MKYTLHTDSPDIAGNLSLSDSRLILYVEKLHLPHNGKDVIRQSWMLYMPNWRFDINEVTYLISDGPTNPEHMRLAVMVIPQWKKFTKISAIEDNGYSRHDFIIIGSLEDNKDLINSIKENCKKGTVEQNKEFIKTVQERSKTWTTEDFEKFGALEPSERKGMLLLIEQSQTEPLNRPYSSYLTSEVTLLLQKQMSWTEVVVFVLDADKYLKEKEKNK